MKKPQTAPDWALMIEQLAATGLTPAAIGRAMSTCVLTNQMLRAYRMGVQPLHFRGEALIALWCVTLERHRDDLPMAELIRGHRVATNRQPAAAPQVINLPAWPPGQILKPVKEKKASKGKQRGAILVAEPA
jgi:hypothetical protein